ncbi:MAG: DUF3168 domain-containing protein [Sphingomonadales bacterium]|nr:DUF3168 domain-containing protein [Sphingomonadales bacterium]
MKGLHTVARRALLTRLKNNAGMNAVVSRNSMFGQSPSANPAWPFTRLGPPQVLPLRGTRLDGAAVNVGFHAFAKPRYQGSTMVETAEDYAGRIGAAFEEAVDRSGETVTVDTKTARVTYQLADILLQRDPAEADAYHYSATVRIRIIAE